jgi:DHA1 family bicyclomycin/chloramphenicol resistance-like MFS transporter
MLVGRLGAIRLLGAGIAAVVAGSAALCAAVAAGTGVAGVLVPLFVVVSSVGLIIPNATALALDAHGADAGAASALLGLTQLGIGAVLPPLVSIRGASAGVMAAAMLGSGLVAAAATAATRAVRATAPG